jgi:glycosyltransferase involved in cell wall biosynthesis
MKVLYVNHTAEVSGAERSLLSLLAALPDTVQAHAAAPPGQLTQALSRLAIPTSPITGTAGSLRLHPLHTPRALAEMSAAALQLHRLSARERPDLVHANSIRAGIVLSLARTRPAATVVHVRDCLPAGALTTATMRLIAASATTIVANSRYTARSVQAVVPAARVEVVHNPVDIVRWNPARIERAQARAALGEAGKRAVLLGVVAQLSPWKGQDTAIEALKLLVDEGVDAHLLLIGSAKFVAKATRFDNDAYVAGLRARIGQAGLRDRVSWLGEREDVPELVRGLDALLLPSREEPFGRALIEAMALEVPVLATSVGGPAEIVQDGCEGYLLTPSEPQAWAQGVRRVIGREDHGAGMGAAGRRRVLEAFTAERHAAAIVAVYERAVVAAEA